MNVNSTIFDSSSIFKQYPHIVSTNNNVVHLFPGQVHPSRFPDCTPVATLHSEPSPWAVDPPHPQRIIYHHAIVSD
jgi:hypothetical protein